MTDYDTPEVEGTDTDERDVRALTQYLTVLGDVGRARGADGLYMVVSQSGKEYLVDAQLGACECPDHEYRDARCKHLRRVAYATGAETIPAGVDVGTIDPDLGRHVDDGPRVAVPDGGQVVDADPDDRPDDCTCLPGFEGLACFSCFAAGWDEPNPDPPTDEEES